MPRSQRVVPALKVCLSRDVHGEPHSLPTRRIGGNDRVQVRDDRCWNAKSLNQRLEAVRVASSDVHEGDILLRELRKISLDEQRHEHALRDSLDENGCVSEQQVGVLYLEVALGENAGLHIVAERITQIHDFSAGLATRGSARQPLHVSQAGETISVRQVAGVRADEQLAAKICVDRILRPDESQRIGREVALYLHVEVRFWLLHHHEMHC